MAWDVVPVAQYFRPKCAQDNCKQRVGKLFVQALRTGTKRLKDIGAYPAACKPRIASDRTVFRVYLAIISDARRGGIMSNAEA